MLAFVALYAINPTEDNVLHRFIFLSYAQQPVDSGAPLQYGKGPRDITFVAFYTIQRREMGSLASKISASPCPTTVVKLAHISKI